MKSTVIRYGTELRVYDNGGKTFDRYTILPPRYAKGYKERNGLWEAIGSSECPFHPQGFGMHIAAAAGYHLGKRIHWDTLPASVKQFAKQSFPEYCPA